MMSLSLSLSLSLNADLRFRNFLLGQLGIAGQFADLNAQRGESLAETARHFRCERFHRCNVHNLKKIFFVGLPIPAVKIAIRLFIFFKVRR